jgi:hypothetical protein
MITTSMAMRAMSTYGFARRLTAPFPAAAAPLPAAFAALAFFCALLKRFAFFFTLFRAFCTALFSAILVTN